MHQITAYRRRRRRFFPGSVPHSSPQCGGSVINQQRRHRLASRYHQFVPEPPDSASGSFSSARSRLLSLRVASPFPSGQLQERGRDGVPYRSGHPKTFLRALTVPTPTIDCIDRSKHTIRVVHVPHAWTRSHRLETTSSVRAASRSCAKSTAVDPCSRRDEQKGCCDHCEPDHTSLATLSRFGQFVQNTLHHTSTCRAETPNHLHLTSTTLHHSTKYLHQILRLDAVRFHVVVFVQLSTSCQL